MTTLLELANVSTRLGGRVIVDNVSLSISAGESVGLIGANGAGKTTLFRTIAGELPHSTGQLRFMGRALPGRPDARARLGLARTFQFVELFGGLSVLDHLLVALQANQLGAQGLLRDFEFHGPTSDEELERCAEVLELCGLQSVAGQPATALSLGERRAVELARALVTRPRLLLADEPSSGLDRDESAALARVIERARLRTGLAVLLVEHDLATVAAVTERVIAMDAGSIVAEGSLNEVVANPRVVASWLGRPA